jgi:hypothetical protein
MPQPFGTASLTRLAADVQKVKFRRGSKARRGDSLFPTFGFGRFRRREILDSDPVPLAQALPSRLDSFQNAGFILEPIVEPLVCGGETHQDPSRATTPRDYDLLLLGNTKVFCPVVFHFGERNLHHVHRAFPTIR